MTRDSRNPRVPRQWVVTVLLRLYPAAWRSEYGPELTEILLARPLGPRVIGDVLWNGLWQRAQAAEPSTILGLASVLILLTGFGLDGGAYGRGGTASLRSTWIVFPTVGVTLLASGVFALLQFVSGCWTHLRHGGKVHQSGVAAVRTSLITGIPIVLGALLMMFGLIDLRFPGTTLPPPSPLAILVAPLTRLPDAWIWGALGGVLGRRITCSRHRANGGAIQP